MDNKIIYIGGSPCSGKSTVAERIAKDRGAYYFKADDHLFELTASAAANNKESCKKITGMTADEIWMRDPFEQCREEFLIYREISGFVFDKLRQIRADLIVAEGAAFTPEVMAAVGYANYITIIPTPEFQIAHYQRREWVPYVLKDCTDKEKAFDHWMQRDILFARQVEEECRKPGIPCIINDGSKTPDTVYDMVKTIVGL